MLQEGVPTAFLRRHQITEGVGAHVALLHLVSSYVHRMRMSPSPLYDLSFALKGKINCGAAVCANWLTDSLCQIGATLHVPKA